MSSEKPWRTVLTGGPTGRFTEEQIRDAVRYAMEIDKRRRGRVRKMVQAKTTGAVRDQGGDGSLVA